VKVKDGTGSTKFFHSCESQTISLMESAVHSGGCVKVVVMTMLYDTGPVLVEELEVGVELRVDDFEVELELDIVDVDVAELDVLRVVEDVEHAEPVVLHTPIDEKISRSAISKFSSTARSFCPNAHEQTSPTARRGNPKKQNILNGDSRGMKHND